MEKHFIYLISDPVTVGAWTNKEEKKNMWTILSFHTCMNMIDSGRILHLPLFTVSIPQHDKESHSVSWLMPHFYLLSYLLTTTGKKEMFWVSLSIFVFFHLTLLSKSSYHSLVIVQHEKRDFYFLVTDKNSLFNVDQWFLTFPLLVFFRECECQIRSLRTYESILLFYLLHRTSTTLEVSTANNRESLHSLICCFRRENINHLKNINKIPAPFAAVFGAVDMSHMPEKREIKKILHKDTSI